MESKPRRVELGMWVEISLGLIAASVVLIAAVVTAHWL